MVKKIFAKKENNSLSFSRTKPLFVTVLFAFAIATGYADEAVKKYSDYKEKNQYKYFSLFVNYLDVSTDISGGVSTISGSSDGWGAGLGVSFNEYLGAEFAHYNFGSFHFENPNLVVDEIESNTNNFALVAKLPIGRFEPFFKAGFSRWWIKDRREDLSQTSFPNAGTIESEDSGTDVFYSFGGSYSFMRGFIDLVFEVHKYEYEPKLYTVSRDWELEFYNLGFKINF